MTLPSLRETLGYSSYTPTQEGFTFSEGFAGKQDLSTDIGRQAWATSGLFGLLASKLYSDESQQEWFVQRNAVDYGYNELQQRIDHYQQKADSVGLTKAEYEDAKESIARRNLIKEDLDFVYDKLDGNLDAVMDTEGNSFKDRWGLDTDEETGLLDLLGVFVDNPSYAGGVITAEVIKDLPFLGIAKLLGIAHKGMSISELVAKINNRLGKIQSKATRGLAQMGTGIGIGTLGGAGYEALYSTLEQGEVKAEDTWMGAKFGGAFGVLGGLGFMYSGSKLSKAEAALAESAGITGKGGKGLKAGVKKEASKATSDALENTRKLAEDDDSNRISNQAQETTILKDYNQDILPGLKDQDVGVHTDFNEIDRRIKTYVDDKALEFERKQMLKDYEKAIKEQTDFKGFPVNKITHRQDAVIRNPDAYRMFRLAESKAYGANILDHIDKTGSVRGLPADLKQITFKRTFDELNKVDEEFVDPKPLDQLNEATEPPPMTPEEQARLEAEEIAKQRMDVESTDEVPQPPPEPGILGKALDKYPKSIAAGGAVAGYTLSDAEGEKMFGAALGVGAALAGPRAYRALTSKGLKATAMKVKVALSKSVEAFSIQSKIFEYQMQEVLKEVAEVFPEGTGIELINAIEDPSIKLTGKKLEVQKKVEALLKEIGDNAVGIGLLRPKGNVTELGFGGFNKEGSGAFLNNYFPHMFNKELDEKDIQELINVYLQESKNVKERTLKHTIAWIEENHRDKNIVTDPVKALSLYTQAMTRTIYGRNLVNSLMGMSLSPDGTRHLPALMSKDAFDSLRKTEAKQGGLSDQEALHYQEFDHPTLKGFVAHSDIKPLIDDQFALLRRGGVGEVMEGILKLNNGLKRIFVFGSLFHAQALLMSASYSLGRHGLTRKIKGGRVAVRDENGKPLKDENGDVIYRQGDFSDLKIGSMEFRDLAEEFIKDGLQIINIKKSDLIDPGFDEAEKLFEKMGFVGKGMSKVFEKTDYLTWEYFHDRFKIATHMQKKQKLIDEGVDPVEAGKLAARFANDAYGSLDWNDFATRLYTYAENNPDKLRGVVADKLAGILPVNKRRWLNLGLFAPDWTISNLRIVGNTFVSGYKLSKHLLKGIHRGDDAAWNSKEGKALLAAFKMYAGYTGRASIITSGMWWAMSEANSAMFGNPEPTAEKLFDFWFGEKSGKLDLGGGEGMVISKQIAEPIHWIQHPQHTLMNKASVIPKTIMEGMFNKQWFSMKKGFPMGPRIIDEDGTSHTPKWILGKAVPIVTKPMFDTKLNWYEKLQRTFSGFFGFPQYGEPGKYD